MQIDNLVLPGIVDFCGAKYRNRALQFATAYLFIAFGWLLPETVLSFVKRKEHGYRICGGKSVWYFCQGANSCCKQINATILSPPLFNGVATYGYYCALIIRGIIGMDAQFTDDAPTNSLQR